jgi:hypothetical protein
VREVQSEGTEETHVELIPLGELREEVRAGRVDHALVIAVAYLYELGAEAPGGAAGG